MCEGLAERMAGVGWGVALRGNLAFAAPPSSLLEAHLGMWRTPRWSRVRVRMRANVFFFGGGGADKDSRKAAIIALQKNSVLDVCAFSAHPAQAHKIPRATAANEATAQPMAIRLPANQGRRHQTPTEKERTGQHMRYVCG